MLSETYLEKATAVSRFALDSRVTHILAPTDLTARCKASVASAVQLARGLDARLTLLHIWGGLAPANLPFSPLYAGQLELEGRKALEESQKAERTLRTIRDKIRAQHSRTEDCFLLGDPGALLILRIARELKVDLMVISAHHYSWLDCLFDGNNGDKLVRDAPCSVLVVPSTEREPPAVEPDSFVGRNQASEGPPWPKQKNERWPIAKATRDRKMAYTSAEKLAKLDPSFLTPGHGPVLRDPVLMMKPLRRRAWKIAQ